MNTNTNPLDLAHAAVVASALAKLLSARTYEANSAYDDLALVVAAAINAGRVERCRRIELDTALRLAALEAEGGAS